MEMLLLYFVVVSFLHSTTASFTFNHDVDFEQDNGDTFRLKSKGKFADIVNLDDVKSISVSICMQLLRYRSLHEIHVHTQTVHNTVVKKWPSFRRAVSKTPFDVLHEAEIHLQYQSGNVANGKSVNGEKDDKNKLRRRRYSSNYLTNFLNYINWHSNASLDIGSNYNSTTLKEEKVFSVDRYVGLKNLIYWDLTNEESEEKRNNFTKLLTTYFSLQCLSCYGLTRINYVFDLVIHNVNNKPIIKKYISQIEAESELHADYQMKFPRETTVTGSRVLWATPKREMFRLPLAIIADNKLPPVELVVTTNDVTFVQIHGAVAGPAIVNIQYGASGHYALSQNFASMKSAAGFASTRAWNVTSWNFEAFSTSKMNITSSIFQTIVLNASVHWSGKDVSASLSPPAIVTIKPKVEVLTNLSELSRTYESFLSIKGDFQFDKASFVVDAFGMHIWKVLLSTGFHRNLEIVHSNELGNSSYTNCFGGHESGPPLSMSEVCGSMQTAIQPPHRSFESLRYMKGDDVIFQTDEDSDWCGDSNMTCQPCHPEGNQTSACMTRFMSPELAMAITRLREFLKTDYPTRKLIVVSSFDEPTSSHPQRRYGNESLHYEGRAAKLGISTENPIFTDVTLETSIVILKKLGQLAICSHFDYVKILENEYVIHVGTKQENQQDNGCENKVLDYDGKCMFSSIMDETAIVLSQASCDMASQDLKVGQTFPHHVTSDYILGAEIGRISRFSPNVNNKLYIYKYDDVMFVDEGKTGDWCGSPLRPCVSCDVVNKTTFWDVCAARIMSPRLALRIRRLATLVQKQSAKITVIQAFVEPTKANPERKELNSLYQEGRAARISLGTGGLGRLTSLAICAGFDFIQYTDSTFIEVFVKSQDGFRSRDVMFPSGKYLSAVSTNNLVDKVEYLFMSGNVAESRKPSLFDGYTTEEKLSDHYKISDFICPGYRFFRLDETLVQCLERASEDLGHRVEVIPNSGYRVRSVNLDNIDIRTSEERFRFQLGQAVEVRSSRDNSTKTLIEVGKSVIRVCPVITRPQQRGIGIGCHKDRLYIDIRPIQQGKQDQFISIWNSGGPTLFYELFAHVYAALSGGPVIVPFDRVSACSTPLGSDFHYLNFQINLPGLCYDAGDENFCSLTRANREFEAKRLQERMSSAAGSNNLPRSEIIGEINACVVDVCGGCSGSGTAWDKKVLNCAKMVKKFISKASRPFQNLHDRATFFNAENSESTVHSLACHFGYICVENVQLYSLLMPLIASTYRPNAKKSVQEKLFSTEDNPSPLLEIVSQELAFRASGNVKVFIDNEMDMSMLRNVLKVLMVYNKNVVKVEFWVTENIPAETVKASIQRKIENWAGTSCTKWSRFAVVPYSVQTVPSHRHKRSIARSIHRNFAKMTMRNWESDWLSKM